MLMKKNCVIQMKNNERNTLKLIVWRDQGIQKSLIKQFRIRLVSQIIKSRYSEIVDLGATMFVNYQIYMRE